MYPIALSLRRIKKQPSSLSLSISSASLQMEKKTYYQSVLSPFGSQEHILSRDRSSYSILFGKPILLEALSINLPSLPLPTHNCPSCFLCRRLCLPEERTIGDSGCVAKWTLSIRQKLCHGLE